jgi:hypothetical protein
MSSDQLLESVFRAELILETLQHSSACAFRQFPSCVAIDNNAVACDCDRIAKRSIAKIGQSRQFAGVHCESVLYVAWVWAEVANLAGNEKRPPAQRRQRI